MAVLKSVRIQLYCTNYIYWFTRKLDDNIISSTKVW